MAAMTGFDQAQGRFDAAVDSLRAAVADLDLTDAEQRTFAWLERWETETIANIASVIRKASAAGYRAGTGTLA